MTPVALKPPFTYFGGKTSVAGKIAALLLPHRHYVEPFAGSLAVLLAKQPSKIETVNDLDGNLMTFWRVLRDRPDELAARAALTPHSRAEHLAAFADWHRYEFPTTTGNAAAGAQGRVEVIWSNRPLASSADACLDFGAVS